MPGALISLILSNCCLRSLSCNSKPVWPDLGEFSKERVAVGPLDVNKEVIVNRRQILHPRFVTSFENFCPMLANSVNNAAAYD
jgi:hypothetical protein